VADWYVYQHDGDYLGPWPTETVAHEILNGKLGPDVWVAAPGSERWVRAMDIPVIARLIEAVPTRPKRRDSGMFVKTLDDVESAAQTLKLPAILSDEEPPTDPGMPSIAPSSSSRPSPSSPSPQSPSPLPPPTPTLESTGNRRRRKNG
jgi:hypothetical protein